MRVDPDLELNSKKDFGLFDAYHTNLLSPLAPRLPCYCSAHLLNSHFVYLGFVSLVERP